MTRSDVSEIAKQLSASAEQLSGVSVVAGFDAFIDEIAEIVEERSGTSEYAAVATLSRMGDLFHAAAGRSSCREIVKTAVQPGGCAVNLGFGLFALGVAVDYFGTLGNPMHPAFANFVASCRSHTILGSAFGQTLALEFSDGKFLLPAVDQLQEINGALLAQACADGRYLKACSESGLIALTAWALYTGMTECWRYLQEYIFPQLTHMPYVFIDVIDPRGRSDADCLEMLEVLAGFTGTVRCVLGGNLNECNHLASLVGIPSAEETPESMQELVGALRKHLNIYGVLVHGMSENAFARAREHRREGQEADEIAGCTSIVCPNPITSTGAGDRFNAGFCAGLLMGLGNAACLTVGAAASGHFVRTGTSATMTDIQLFLQRWKKGALEL